MFHNQKSSNHMNNIQEKALRIVYQGHNSKFDELLVKDCSFKIHDRNLGKLLIKIFKVKVKLVPEIMNDVFDRLECPYPLRNELRFKSQNICIIKFGIEIASFVGSRIWNCMAMELKECTLLNKFRSKIETWAPENGPCKLCKI